MKGLCRFLTAVVGVEFLVAGWLVVWRLNSTLPVPPPVDQYTDAITGRELLAAADRFLFDGAVKWRTLGEMYLASGFFAKSEACLGRAALCAPQSVEIALLHGDCLERLGMLEEAAEEFRRAAGLERDSAPAWYRLGRIHLQLEKPAEAARAFERAGDDHPASVYQRARLLIGDQHPAEARELLDRLAETNPDDLLVWRRRGEIAAALGEASVAAAARDAAERSVVTLQLDEAHARLAAAREQFGLERLLRQALEENERGRGAVAAQRLMQLTRDELRWWNRYPMLLEQAAELQLQVGEVAGARELLERQIEEFGMPTARALELHGAVEFFEGNSEQAWRDWRRSENMQPAAIDHHKLARIAEQQRDVALARRHQSLEKQLAALVAFRSNRLDEARSGLHEALSIEPKLPDAWFYLGETERALDNHDVDNRAVDQRARAQVAYERCLALNPCHGRARRRLDLLKQK